MALRVALEFRCLGGFAFGVGDRWRSAPTKAHGGEFLAYLASHSHSTVFRDTLSEAFWPELNSEQSAHRLHLAASGARAAVRSVLPSVNPIVFSNDSYSWSPEVEVRSDADRLEKCFNDGSPSALCEGIGVYGGQFLAGDYADWVLPLRVRYEHMYVTMLEQLARAALQAEDYARATNYALQLVQVDRANERATQLVMVSTALAGHRSVALSEYAKLEQYLRRWLGVEPMAGTRQIRDEIAQGKFPSSPVGNKA